MANGHAANERLPLAQEHISLVVIKEGELQNGCAEKAEIAPLGSFLDVEARLLHRRRYLLGVGIGSMTGLVAAAYNKMFEGAIALCWGKAWPALFVALPRLPVWIGLCMTCTILGMLVGASMWIMGQPTANLPGLVSHFHEGLGRVTCSVYRTVRIAIVSTIGICGAGSLGPEAPLVSMGAGVANAIMKFIGHPDDSVVATLCGMSSAFSAFFGDPVGGTVFALEVVHRNGLEFYEALVPGVLSGISSCIVCRLVLGKHHMVSSQTWSTTSLPTQKTTLSVEQCVAYGLAAGVIGGSIGKAWIKALRLIKPRLAALPIVVLTALGGLLIGAVGALAPATLFWGEYEIGCLLDPNRAQPHAPSNLPFAPLDSPVVLLETGLLKMIAILVTVAASYRGGFIFPFMHAGIAVGSAIARCLHIDVAIFALATGAAVNVAPTRTPVGTSLIMATLSNRADALFTLFIASVVSLVLSADVAVITAAKARFFD